MVADKYSWNLFVELLKNQEISSHRKSVQLAIASLKSEDGTSYLFTDCCNPYKTEYRGEMFTISKPVVHDNRVYCHFNSEQDSVIGFWVALTHRQYAGWQQQNSVRALTQHLIDCNYFGNDIDTRTTYLKNILALSKI